MPLCSRPVLDSSLALRSNLERITLQLDHTYHTTHTSSQWNESFGGFENCHVWNLELTRVLSNLCTRPQFLHVLSNDELISSEIYNESDVVGLAAVALWRPILQVLRYQMDHLEFELRSEDIQTMEGIVEGEVVNIKSIIDTTLRPTRK